MSVLSGPKILGTMIGASLGDTYLTEGNTTLRGWQALVQANVINRTTNTPPGTPANGDTYIVGSSPTGAWTGHANAIAYYTTQNLGTAGWDFWTPANGWLAYSQADSNFYKYNGSSWVVAFSSGSFTTAGTALFTGGQTINAPTGAGAAFSPGAPNKVICCRLVLVGTYTVRSIALRVQSGSGGADFACCAIYDAAGTTKVLDAGTNAFSVNSGATNTSVSITPVTIGNAAYWFACSATTTSAQSGGSHPITSASAMYTATNLVQTVVGTSANSLSAGAMPSSLGAITPDATFDFPAFVFLV